jgi:UDP-2-acetamido-3-amino-2,3-dideoxy-glucuronate N-acetyltransferase
MKLKPKFSIIIDAEIGEGTSVHDQVNLYKCKIGKNCKIGSFVYIEEGVIVGDNCRIKPFVFIPTGVTIENNVCIGPSVTFTNHKYPEVSDDWILARTTVKEGASLGANWVIVPGITIGKFALIGSGAVVSKNVPDYAIMAGNPARILRYRGK